METPISSSINDPGKNTRRSVVSSFLIIKRKTSKVYVSFHQEDEIKIVRGASKCRILLSEFNRSSPASHWNLLKNLGKIKEKRKRFNTDLLPLFESLFDLLYHCKILHHMKRSSENSKSKKKNFFFKVSPYLMRLVNKSTVSFPGIIPPDSNWIWDHSFSFVSFMLMASWTAIFLL